MARDLWDSGVGPPQWLEDGIMVESLQVGRKPKSLRCLRWKGKSIGSKPSFLFGEPMFFFPPPPWECRIMLGYQQLDGLCFCWRLKHHELIKRCIHQNCCSYERLLVCPVDKSLGVMVENLPQFAGFISVHIIWCINGEQLTLVIRLPWGPIHPRISLWQVIRYSPGGHYAQHSVTCRWKGLGEKPPCGVCQ